MYVYILYSYIMSDKMNKKRVTFNDYVENSDMPRRIKTKLNTELVLNDTADFEMPLLVDSMTDMLVNHQPEYIDTLWAKSLIDSIKPVSNGNRILCRNFLILIKIKEDSMPRDGPTLKVVLIERLLLAMCKEPCQDKRLCDEKRMKPIVQPELLAGEENGITNFLFPGRNFIVNDPLAFNKAFRYLQISNQWPRKNMSLDSGTKGITQILDALGIGPVEKSDDWTGKKKSVRGPTDTDPSKGYINGKWQTCKGDRDSLYFRKYVFNLSRMIKNSKNIYNTIVL
jgi:hypothetical protein